MLFDNCLAYSPLTSNVKFIEKVIANIRGGTPGSISNLLTPDASSQQSLQQSLQQSFQQSLQQSLQPVFSLRGGPNMPESSSDSSNSGRPILGRNAEYYAEYGINTFPPEAVLPTTFAYSLVRRTPRYHAPKPKVRVLKKECVFCKRLGKPNFDTHWLKTSQNVVTCPELRKYKCTICGCQGGDDAHTSRFCPMIRTCLGEQFQASQQVRQV